jgi:hypothetical protein
MPAMRNRIIKEIKLIEKEIDAQKRAIKHNTNNGPAVEVAEQNLKQLHTRLGVLQTNLKKCDPASSE